MYTPPPINELPPFPTGDQNKHIQLPLLDEVEIGDILISRYNKSRWAEYFPWEDWHHTALISEPYTLASSKWSESSWYCSSLIYKSYSRTITEMYLEKYDDIRAGFFVTPEDLLNSKRTKQYFSWKYKNNILIEV